MKVGGFSDWPQNSIDHTFGCFGAKFNFQVLSMSADLGLDEKIFQEIHYHTWDYHPCHFGANILTPLLS